MFSSGVSCAGGKHQLLLSRCTVDAVCKRYDGIKFYDYPFSTPLQNTFINEEKLR